MWDCHFDQNILFFRAIFDDLAIGEALVIDLGDFFTLYLSNSFRLGVTHYSYNINQISILHLYSCFLSPPRLFKRNGSQATFSKLSSLIVLRFSVIENNFVCMSCQTKPVHEYFNQVRYLRHKHKLATIDSERPQPFFYDQLASNHRLRNHSIAFHQQEQEDFINNQNEKLLSKLLEISKRRKSQYTMPKPMQKIVSYNNPARKKREKMITEMNLKMAERLLTKQSSLDRKFMRRSMEEYQSIKKTISNNKKAMYASIQFQSGLPLLKDKDHPMNKSRRKKVQLSEQKTAYNPQLCESIV